MKIPKHLPEDLWAEDDDRLFEAAYREGDIFDDNRGPGCHLSKATRTSIHYAWRRWLGFLDLHRPDVLYLDAADRITPVRVRAYVEHLRRDLNATSLASTVAKLHAGAQLLAPDRDWFWLKAIKTRLLAQARPEDRFEHLVPAHQTLDLGIRLMDEALALLSTRRHERELQYRDGLILAVLSLWPIRRRSITALTLTHLHLDDDRADFDLGSSDTKAKRAESWPVPQVLVSYLKRYLVEIRPALVRGCSDALWPSLKGGGLRGGRIYSIVRRRTREAFGRAMALHDFRRAAATFLAMDAPEKIGLVPGILQHANAETGDRYYNLARSSAASKRHVKAVSVVRDRLRGELRYP